jgi:DNA-binding transcriptional LysR family regulator
MELSQIRHFIAVVETGGFTKAAERLAVTQPAISASIAKLEAELATQLLDRQHTQVIPTPEGMRFLEVGKEILQKCNTVKAEFEAIANRRPLRIGILRSLFSGRVSRLVSAFRLAKPHVPIEAVDSESNPLCQCARLLGLAPGQELDAVLTIFIGNEQKAASRVLFKMPYMLAVREDHRFAQRQAVALVDLANELFILPEGCPGLQEVTNVLASRGIAIRVAYKTDRDDMALALVAAGVGLAFVPGQFEVPTVKQVPVPDLGIFREVGLIWQRERKGSALKEFIDFAATHCWSAEDVRNRDKQEANGLHLDAESGTMSGMLQSGSSCMSKTVPRVVCKR